MRRISFTFLFVLLTFGLYAQSTYVRFETKQGNIVVMLYDEIPRHKAMFLKQIKKGTYKQAEFNRVIKDFVNQGGELDDSILNREKRHPELGAPRFPAEIKPHLIHKRGTFGAGRDDNPEKASYFNQIYFVIGKKWTDSLLDRVEKRTGRKIPMEHREIYKTLGGVPHLDGDYTLFGEIVQGLEVAEAINSVATDKNDVPLSPVVFNAVVLSKKEAAKLKKKLKSVVEGNT
ncbi:peptidylprolyl isomerase [Pedobacter sp. GR22-6]|uniref:peptidylprolyl isomerase n=1 Tax=Pedobacter sp. GR22-6 TaxID=3127957 RepID=UPI00307EB380